MIKLFPKSQKHTRLVEEVGERDRQLRRADKKKMAKDNIHVVMVPWSAFGHIVPFFQLSISLARAGVRVSFLSTPKNIRRLPEVPPDVATLVHLVEFPLPAGDSGLLPESAEATVDVPFEKIQYLKIAYDLLQQPFKLFVQKELPDWIITDLIPHWTVDIAQELHIPLIIFFAFSAATVVFFGPPEFLAGEGQKRLRARPESLTSPPEWVNFPSKVAYRSFEAPGVHAGFYGENASGITDGQRIAKIMDACEALAIRSCPGVEAEYLSLEANISGKPVISLGLLPPDGPDPPKSGEISDESWREAFKWLDEQKPRSVVFVGFGSECKLNKEQVHEIAHGLVLSELPFLWVLQKPNWATDETDVLPPEFGCRTAGKGVVQMGWAPQKEILAHPSIGGSLFHSGWGSVIETLQYGHCLVVLPFIIDQPLNARSLVEKGLAIEVERSQDDGSFSREDIAKCLRHAMVSEEGEELRSRAGKAATVFSDRKLHDYYIGRFAEYLRNGAKKQTAA